MSTVRVNIDGGWLVAVIEEGNEEQKADRQNIGKKRLNDHRHSNEQIEILSVMENSVQLRMDN